MDSTGFDRLARGLSDALSKSVPRRRLLAIVALLCGWIMAIFRHMAATGMQLGPATCGREGAACTLLRGCCCGFTCATSRTNTSYGICVTGSGGMMPVSFGRTQSALPAPVAASSVSIAA